MSTDLFRGQGSSNPSEFKYFDLLESSSFIDDASLSCSSEYTSTSTSTNPGPGSISGKGVLAFGKMVLRSLDGVTIRRRLPELKICFPHTDSDVWIDDFDKLYADVLELSRYVPALNVNSCLLYSRCPSRCDLYGDDIRKQALQLILIQIACRNTVHLIQSIIRWPPYEIYLLLVDILMSMPSPWLGTTR
jgi:hypothetical protein